MPAYVFIERSRFGKVIFELNDERVRVSGRRGWQSFDTDIEFHALRSGHEEGRARILRPAVLGMSLGLLMLAMTAGLVLQRKIQVGAVLLFAYPTGLMGAVFLGTGLRWLGPFEVVRFRDLGGSIVFDVVKEKSCVGEVDEFVAELERRIASSRHPSRTSSS